MGFFAQGGRLLGRRPGPAIVLCGGMLFMFLVLGLIMLGALQPRCNSDIMPCSIDEKGGCLCSARASDGTCWQRMEPAMKCYRSTMTIKSGICQGNYETAMCGTSQEEVDSELSTLGSAVTVLHPDNLGNCNVTYKFENQRCRLPEARHETTPFVKTSCCRAPIQTCVSDNDCCNCGQESEQCTEPLKCMETRVGANGTVSESVDCDRSQDACLMYNYVGCTNLEDTCGETGNTQPFVQDLDPACCDGDNPSCSCRPPCQAGSIFEGCTCITNNQGCFRQQCIQTSTFFGDGGVERVLNILGAETVKLCYTDNCNQ